MLKALANSSPGWRFGNPGDPASYPFLATLERSCARLQESECGRNSFQSCDENKLRLLPRVAKSATLGWNLRTLKALPDSGTPIRRLERLRYSASIQREVVLQRCS